MSTECSKCGLAISKGRGKWFGEWVEVDRRSSFGMPEICMAIPGDDRHEPGIES